jgi:hypothetical protein
MKNQLYWHFGKIYDAFNAEHDNFPLNLNIPRISALLLFNVADFGKIGVLKKIFRLALTAHSGCTLTEKAKFYCPDQQNVVQNLKFGIFKNV